MPIPKKTIVGLALLLCPAIATAQDPEYIEDRVGPAAQQMHDEGLWHEEHLPRALEIAQQHGIWEAYGISPDEARDVLRGEREDRDRGGRLGSVSLHERLFQVGYLLPIQRTGNEMSCDERQKKQEAAIRLRDRLGSLAYIYGTSVGIVGGILAARTEWTPPPGSVYLPKTPRFFAFIVPLTFGAALTGMMANYAGQIATAYQYAPCTAGGQVPCVQKPTSIIAIRRTLLYWGSRSAG